MIPPGDIAKEQCKILMARFESEADYAARRGKLGRECFDRLKASVEFVPDELLDAYHDMFDDIVDSEFESELMWRIQSGLWEPESATEYLQRFIAVAPGAALRKP
jgi:hypothetical protein